MKKQVLVVVLGPLSQSPRMKNHCLSLVEDDHEVTVIANGPIAKDEFQTDRDITLKLMTDVPNFKKLQLILKPVWQTFALIYQLILITKPDIIVAQNPPSVPTIPILWLYSRIVSAKLIIDWHNYGFSILALKLGESHILVKILKFLEIFFGRKADIGFCVTEAFKKELQNKYKIDYPLHVLHDRPPKHFKPFQIRQKHGFFMKLKDSFDSFKHRDDENLPLRNISKHQSTRFTMIDENIILYKPERPAIIFSSTSWTEDEDFGILLKALAQYDELRDNDVKARDEGICLDTFCLPKLVCVITGRGPLKSYWESEIPSYKFKHVEFVFPWLSASDYSKMVASSDVGISLHISSSGVDLPMKVVDMFGCGIPVLAYYYPTIEELVVDDFYGRTFSNHEELASQLTQLLEKFYNDDGCKSTISPHPIEHSDLRRYRKNITTRYLLSRWEDNWVSNVAQCFT